MTLDTRARQAAQGIHRAVDVSQTAKAPTQLERFDAYADRKQRNRRRGAILVAAAITIAAILVGTQGLDRGQRQVVPVQPPGTEEMPPVEPMRIGTITQSRARCTLDFVTGPIIEGPVSFALVNETDTLVAFDLAKFLLGTELTYEQFESHVRNERRRAEKGKPFVGPPAGAQVLIQTKVRPGTSETVTATLSSGTYAVVCLHKVERVGVRPFALVGPLEFTQSMGPAEDTP